MHIGFEKKRKKQISRVYLYISSRQADMDVRDVFLPRIDVCAFLNHM